MITIQKIGDSRLSVLAIAAGLHVITRFYNQATQMDMLCTEIVKCRHAVHNFTEAEDTWLSLSGCELSKLLEWTLTQGWLSLVDNSYGSTVEYVITFSKASTPLLLCTSYSFQEPCPCKFIVEFDPYMAPPKHRQRKCKHCDTMWRIPLFSSRKWKHRRIYSNLFILFYFDNALHSGPSCIAWIQEEVVKVLFLRHWHRHTHTQIHHVHAKHHKTN